MLDLYNPLIHCQVQNDNGKFYNFFFPYSLEYILKEKHFSTYYLVTQWNSSYGQGRINAGSFPHFQLLSLLKLILFHIWPGSIFKLAPESFWCDPVIFDNLLALWHDKMFQAHFVHSYSRTRINYFSKKPWHPSVENLVVFQYHRLGTRMLVATRLVIVFKPFLVDRARKIICEIK